MGFVFGKAKIGRSMKVQSTVQRRGLGFVRWKRCLQQMLLVGNGVMSVGFQITNGTVAQC